MANHTPKPVKEFEEKVIEIKRVSQKTKGGNKISFSALVVIGDRKGKAGVGFSKAPDVLSAIQKSIKKAKKRLTTIKMVGANTISHEIIHKYKGAYILLKPAPEGTGVIAGGPVRAVVDAFGIRNLVSKRIGSSNKTLNVYATFDAIKNLKLTENSQKQPEDKKEELKTIQEPKNKEIRIKPEENKKEAKKVTEKPVKTKKAVVKKSKSI